MTNVSTEWASGMSREEILTKHMDRVHYDIVEYDLGMSGGYNYPTFSYIRNKIKKYEAMTPDQVLDVWYENCYQDTDCRCRIAARGRAKEI